MPRALWQEAPVQITIIDRRNYHTFQPLLYQVATAGLSPGEIAAPIRSILRSHKNVEVLMAEVTGFDLERRIVETRGRQSSLRLPDRGCGSGSLLFRPRRLGAVRARPEDHRRCA